MLKPRNLARCDNAWFELRGINDSGEYNLYALLLRIIKTKKTSERPEAI
jgi:hypothetical protein